MRLAILLSLAILSAGCLGSGATGSTATGTFTLEIADSLTEGDLRLSGAYLRGPDGWVQALGNGTAFSFTGSGGNVSADGDVPAATYDRLRLLFDSMSLGGRTALLTQTGIELAVNLTVARDGATHVGLAFAWPDAFFESEQGLAFTPVLSRMVVTEDGVETTRLEAQDISTGSGKAPVARMRIFDSTGLEVFASTFVADSPENPVVGNAGNITFTATGSEALQSGATLASYSWEIAGETLTGNTVVWPAPLDGGNVSVRLTVTDSDGNADAQTARLAIKPGTASRTLTITGTATGVGGTEGVEEHLFDVDAASFENASALLSHVTLVLTPGAATIPITDLDVTLDDGAGTRIGSQTGQGSQHTIDADLEEPASGSWKVRVIPDPAYDAAYTVTVTLTWKGVNPGMEAFLASYEDGHSHEH